MASATDLIRAWQTFARTQEILWEGQLRLWSDYIAGAGHNDERPVVAPLFRKFALQFLDFDVGRTLAYEQDGTSGIPDYTPADAVAHPFVFDTKPTSQDRAPHGEGDQVDRYLTLGHPRIRKVVLTNLIAIRVFELDESRKARATRTIDLRGLLTSAPDYLATTEEGLAFATFIGEFRRRELTIDQKLEVLRAAPPWSPSFESSDAGYIAGRLDLAVQLLQADVDQQIESGAIQRVIDEGTLSGDELLAELRDLEWRLGSSEAIVAAHSLPDYMNGPAGSPAGNARRQYLAHVAYYAVTRLLLIRIWEDLELLETVLRDGPFDEWMKKFHEVLDDVVAYSFRLAQGRYPSLFARPNTYTWFTPSRPAYVDVIYILANTYFGQIESDVVGVVYERLLERIDRKSLGQYYTPRDVIRLIWDLIDDPAVFSAAEEQGRAARVLDIATGSGGFLVEGARRLRKRLESQLASGASIDVQTWLTATAKELVGVEIQRFPAYLAELNLLIQFALVLKLNPAARIPPLSVLYGDTLQFHNPVDWFQPGVVGPSAPPLHIAEQSKRERYETLADPSQNSNWMDIVCGNPPYVGEKRAAARIQQLRERYPYWRHFVSQHPDYLYYFLILGVSKLRQGGRFGFITTEYWLGAGGAAKLRGYLARTARIDRIIIYRTLRLFPDAPGQHSMIIVGERTTRPDSEIAVNPARPSSRPLVSIYEGGSVSGVDRELVFQAFRDGASRLGVRTFRASVDPNMLGEESWRPITLTASQLKRRERFRKASTPLPVDIEEGVLTSADALDARGARLLTQAQLQQLGAPTQRPGIFVLKPSERAAFGRLSSPEEAVLLPVIDTRHIFPYAAVLFDEPKQLIYLPAPVRSHGAAPNTQHTLPFPQGLPDIERHLRRFEPVLVDKVRRYGESRPWWSIHRPRPEFMGLAAQGRWAGYAVTARWGGGGKLIIGLSPAGAAPASGLHVVYGSEPIHAAYLVGLLNSTLAQSLVEALPPGQLRKSDLRALGLPFIPDLAADLQVWTLDLAALVRTLVIHSGPIWPRLPDVLRDDVTLAEVPVDDWSPQTGPAALWGHLSKVNWIDSIDAHGGQRVTLTRVEVEHDLFGLSIAAYGPARQRIVIRLKSPDDDLATKLACRLRSLRFSGQQLGAVAEALVPIDSEQLKHLYDQDVQSLDSRVIRYRAMRAQIDSSLASFL